ncbi:MAG: ATP-binding cassette domain-containing protein [Chloroflexi bacterium]|nr:ATP-binding cassette domain-containing protein [Chloroflexota bacterium]
MEPSAALRGVTVVLDDRAILRGIDLDLGPGLTILRGANGSGKTTLLRAVAGLTPLSRGTRATSEPPLLVSHRTALLRALTARENLAFFTTYRGIAAAHVDQALARWGLAADADRPLERLSAGQRRRAALARLDAEDARIALLDEPFSELDAEGTQLVAEALARWTAERRIVLVATHGHSELDRAAARVLAVVDASVRQQ